LFNYQTADALTAWLQMTSQLYVDVTITLSPKVLIHYWNNKWWSWWWVRL